MQLHTATYCRVRISTNDAIYQLIAPNKTMKVPSYTGKDASLHKATCNCSEATPESALSACLLYAVTSQAIMTFVCTDGLTSKERTCSPWGILVVPASLRT